MQRLEMIHYLVIQAVEAFLEQNQLWTLLSQGTGGVALGCSLLYKP
jgi:hypothetical protein